MSRRSALGLLGLGAVGGAVYGLSRSEVLAFLKSDAEAPEDFNRIWPRLFGESFEIA